MQIGINWNFPRSTPIIERICQTGDVDFCELLIDNFLLYEPEILKDALPTASCAFHILNSDFLQRPRAELEVYAARIKKVAALLKPLYISDHIGVSSHKGRQLPSLAEVNYKDFLPLFEKRALLWGDMLESFVYYENFPSFKAQPESQVQFYRQIQERLPDHLNILFDVSNAIVAGKNGCEEASEWKDVAAKTSRYHVGSYKRAENTPYYLDSHDQSISPETLHFLKKHSKVLLKKIQPLLSSKISRMNLVPGTKTFNISKERFVMQSSLSIASNADSFDLFFIGQAKTADPLQVLYARYFETNFLRKVLGHIPKEDLSDHKILFRQFLEYASQQNLEMDWRLGLQFLQWAHARSYLEQICKTPEHIAARAAHQWINAPHQDLDQHWILIPFWPSAPPDSPWILGQKSQSPADLPRLFKIVPYGKNPMRMTYLLLDKIPPQILEWTDI